MAPAAPALDAELRARVALSRVPGIGSVLLTKLIGTFGSAERCLRASERELHEAGLSARSIVAILELQRQPLEPDLEERLERLGVELIPRESERYPALLREIFDAPPLLYVRGELNPQELNAVAIVGTRRPRGAARSLAYEMAQAVAGAGGLVVSGFAEGIDTAAHLGALDAGGRTVAVLGCGLAHLYPNRPELAGEIARSGALVSELPLDVPARRQNFPARNRLISGLAIATVIVEAPAKSGSLHTARQALEQGREVLVVPGDGSVHTAGSDALLADGATPVTSPEELLQALAHLPRPDPDPNRRRFPRVARPEPKAERETSTQEESDLSPLPNMSPIEQKIWGALSHEPTHLDAIVQITGLSAAQVQSTLMMMELKAWVRQMPGGRYVKRKGEG